MIPSVLIRFVIAVLSGVVFGLVGGLLWYGLDWLTGRDPHEAYVAARAAGSVFFAWGSVDGWKALEVREGRRDEC